LKNRLREHLLFLAPPGFWLLIFFVVPLLLIFGYSFAVKDAYGGVQQGFTLENFAQVFDPLYLPVFIRSVVISFGITILTILLGYPVAYYISFTRSKLKYLLLFAVTLPLWTNFLVKVYSFMILLGENGLINSALLGSGIISEPLPLINNSFSLVLSFVYINLPFLIMPVYASLDKIDPSIIEASHDLGASSTATFFRVILPYSAPGMAAGVVFVLIPTLTNFLVPEFLGGMNNYMIGNLIQQQFSHSRNLPLGAAFSSVMIVAVVIMVSLYLRYFNPYKDGKEENER